MHLTPTALPDQLPFWRTWHRERGATGHDDVHRELREQFLAALHAARRSRVLDLGCGQGHDLEAMTKAGHRAVGLDFAPEAVTEARRAVRRARWSSCSAWLSRAKKDIRLHDIAERLPFEDDSFDGVYSHLALHYFRDDVTRDIFDEIKRVMKSDGILAFSVKSVDDPYFGRGERLDDRIYSRKGHVRHFFDQPYIEDLLADWRIERVEVAEGHYACSERSAFIRAVARKRA